LRPQLKREPLGDMIERPAWVPDVGHRGRTLDHVA